MHDLLSVIEQRKMCRYPENIKDDIAELRRIYRRQSEFHRMTPLTESSEHYIVYDEEPERDVVELKKGDDS
jgi:hypothetical protein